MSIFETLQTLGFSSSLKEDEKIKNEEESLELILEHLGDDLELMDMQSHFKFTKFEGKEKIYRFTLKLMSLDFLARLGKDKRVKNVFFAARHPHPGGGADTISLRHKVLIEYH